MNEYSESAYSGPHLDPESFGLWADLRAAQEVDAKKAGLKYRDIVDLDLLAKELLIAHTVEIQGLYTHKPPSRLSRLGQVTIEGINRSPFMWLFMAPHHRR